VPAPSLMEQAKEDGWEKNPLEHKKGASRGARDSGAPAVNESLRARKSYIDPSFHEGMTLLALRHARPLRSISSQKAARLDPLMRVRS